MINSEKRKNASAENGRKGGRPVASKTIITQMMRERIAEKLYARINPLIDAQLNSAIGIMLKKVDSKGMPYYSEESPNTNAAKFLVEQALGRPKESIEHSGGVKGIVGLISSLNESDSENIDEY